MILNATCEAKNNSNKFITIHGDERISTGIRKFDKRVVVQTHLKSCNLKINDNNTVLKAA